MRSDRVLFPESGFTLHQAVDYYRRIAKKLLPHLRNRPLSFKRYPDTVDGESFWEKDAPSFTPDWVKRFPVPRKSDGTTIEYIVVNDAKTLVWVASVGGIELHPFLHRIPRIAQPASIVFDLDPGTGATLRDCCKVALLLRDALGHLQSFAKVSGSKGVQVYVPLNTPVTHDDTEQFARLMAEELARAYPKLVTAKMAKAHRAGKVFIDWSQNADYKTTVSVWSLRAKRSRPYVSVPVSWEEVASSRRLDFSPDDALARDDLFAPVLRIRQKIVERRAIAPTRATRAPLRGLPKPESQSGRRLFVLPKTEMGNELWLDMHGKFRRWILRPDRRGGEGLIAMPAGQFPIDPAYFRGEVPRAWRGRVSIEDVGAYEIIDGSLGRQRLDLYFTGKTLRGEWVLEKIEESARHRSWSFSPAR